MELAISTSWFSFMKLEEVLSYLDSKGIHRIELSAGGLLSKQHIDPEKLLNSTSEFNEFTALLNKYQMKICSLKVHGNIVHPNEEIADRHTEDFKNAIMIAERLGVAKVCNFSGCPGDPSGSKYPNWVIQPFPEYFQEIYEYQWNKVLIPKWKQMAEFSMSHGINQLCVEMYPGFNVYNPESFWKLRNAVGETIGCCFDPSHIMWQGIDPSVAIRNLGKAIYHFHAKDSSEEQHNISLNGRLDPKCFTDWEHRSWFYRAVGYGHDEKVWKDMMSNLRIVGYDGDVCLEHDDAVMTPMEGFEKSLEFVQNILIREKSNGLWWNHH